MDTKSKINNYLQEMWLNMQDDCSQLAINKFKGALDLALSIGKITDNEFELWEYRIKNCPEPDHIGGRTWCAYCGEIHIPD